MGSVDAQYQRAWPAEPLSLYGEGGLYPVQIEDLYKSGRYRVLNKLGYGGYSTVWAALDLKTNTTVALKAISAAESKDNQELRILQHIRDHDAQQHPGRKYLPTLLDHFYEEGCLFLVHELLVDGLEVLGFLTLPFACQISKQLLLAVDCLHSFGIVHGDLYYANVLFYIPSGHKADIPAACQMEHKRKDGGPLPKGIPRYQIDNARCSDMTKGMVPHLRDIQIIDVSSAFFADQRPEWVAAPGVLSAPEGIFRKPLGKGLDVWSIALMTFLWVTGAHAFEFDNDLARISETHEVIGESSAPWLLTSLLEGLKHGLWENKNMGVFDFGCDSLETMLHNYYAKRHPSMSATERRCLENIGCYLRMALVADPSKRATVEDLRRAQGLLDYPEE